MLIIKFHQIRYEYQSVADLLPLDKKVDFYFDDQSGGATQIAMDWETYRERAPREIRELYGAMPRFESDEHFMPLQAADFWAWWVREGYETEALAQYQSGDFGSWRGTMPISSIGIEITEDQLVENLISKIKTDMGIGILSNFYDERTTPRNEIREMPRIERMSRSSMFSFIGRMFRKRRD
jgi:hypothetical protein